MEPAVGERTVIDRCIKSSPEVHSFPGKGRLTAWWMKAKHLFSRGDSSLIEELYQKITSKNGPEISASTLCWFSNKQLTTLKRKIATVEKTKKTVIQNFFKEAVVVAHQRKHSNQKQYTLAALFKSCEEKIVMVLIR